MGFLLHSSRLLLCSLFKERRAGGVGHQQIQEDTLCHLLLCCLFFFLVVCLFSLSLLPEETGSACMDFSSRFSAYSGTFS